MNSSVKLTAGTGTSITINKCQLCDSNQLDSFLFLGYIPPVNQLHLLTERPHEQPAYPAEVLLCNKCKLVQLGCIVDPEVLFPPGYPYTSGTTGILHKNFTEMVTDYNSTIAAQKNESLVVDIGSNDGTLLSKWAAAGYTVHGIEPTDKAQLANSNGINTLQAFFTMESARKVRDISGRANVITATNVFAHIENIHGVVKAILELLDDDGVFISESHYLKSLLKTIQYDTIYHEHLRYYSLHSLKYLLEMHELEIIHAKEIPTHGGSIRVYAARKGVHEIRESVQKILKEELDYGVTSADVLHNFAAKVARTKLDLYSLLRDIKSKEQRIFAIGAPSRASTLITYTGLDNQIIDCVLEIPGSYKIGKYMPGTLIPVREESVLYEEQPEYAILLSWHIADELIPKIKGKGYKGDFIIPLPSPVIVNNSLKKIRTPDC